jgi:hypothetical protein
VQHPPNWYFLSYERMKCKNGFCYEYKNERGTCSATKRKRYIMIFWKFEYSFESRLILSERGVTLSHDISFLTTFCVKYINSLYILNRSKNRN